MILREVSTLTFTITEYDVSRAYRTVNQGKAKMISWGTHPEMHWPACSSFHHNFFNLLPLVNFLSASVCLCSIASFMNMELDWNQRLYLIKEKCPLRFSYFTCCIADSAQNVVLRVSKKNWIHNYVRPDQVGRNNIRLVRGSAHKEYVLKNNNIICRWYNFMFYTKENPRYKHLWELIFYLHVPMFPTLTLPLLMCT